GGTVGRWRVGAHPETMGNRLKGLLLLMNAMPAPPPPCLMHERSVRRIHQADDSVIDTHRHVRSEIGNLVLVAEDWNAWHREPRLSYFAGPGSRRTRFGNVNPDVIVLFGASKAASVDSVDF